MCPLDEITRLAMIEQINIKTSCTNTIKLKCIMNSQFLDATNNSTELVIFSKDNALGVVVLRSI